MNKFLSRFLAVALLWSPSCFALINASTVSVGSPSPFRNTVSLRFVGNGEIHPSCTGARIAPHTILTAAHCVMTIATKTIDANVANGLTFLYTNAANPVAADWKTGTIAGVYVYDGVWAVCPPGTCTSWTQVLVSSPEIAVIRTTAPLNIAGPAAYVDTTYVGADNRIEMTGYGCESGPLDLTPLYPAGYSRLTHATSTVWSAARLFASIGLSVFPETGAFFSPGNSMFRTEPSLCPGDSGGPVYRADGARNNIVGVNFGGPEGMGLGGKLINDFSRVQPAERWLRSVMY